MPDRAQSDIAEAGSPARLVNPVGRSPVVLVCEHASCHIPAEFADLGLAPEARRSHVAWDPGALEVARALSRVLDAPLVASTVSRLVYDCNRPPEAPDSTPARSEVFDIPGNAGLDAAARRRRAALYYEPFRALLHETLSAPGRRTLVTVHSFTPVYMGRRREVELGILHDADSRLADEMLRLAPTHCRMRAWRNAPYGPEDGVTHTLRVHGLSRGIPNVMLEIRNDLIADEASQQKAGQCLAALLAAALEALGIDTRPEGRR